jgi:glycosyltransferase involved in cell wall biosynthesis
MILVTFAGATSALTGRTRSVVQFGLARSSSPAEALMAAFDKFQDEKEAFLFVQPGGRVWTAPVFNYLKGPAFDVAACVDRIGAAPLTPRQFDGIGIVGLETLLLRPTPGAERLLLRWIDRNAAVPGREDVNLCVALAETRDVSFAFLPPSWRWQTGSAVPESDAVVRFGASGPGLAPPPAPRVSDLAVPKTPEPSTPKRRSPEVVVVGHFFQYTGYGKMNREVLLRIANSMSVRIDDTHKEPVYVAEDIRARLDVHKRVLVGPRAPLLRIMGPDHITDRTRHRIVYTMQESSERVHPDMVKRANENFDELWTPTQWNADVFKASGVKLPMQVIPLGVDTAVYRPIRDCKLPPCRLISMARRGFSGVPPGFTFLTVGLPGFRKGWDVIADAMELAFSGRKNVNLVIALTHSPTAWKEKVYQQFAKYTIPIWTLEGSFDEHELARIYSSVDAYVSASRGEGFNLPALEAAACGRPVIVPNNTAHTEIFGPEAYLFDPDGVKTYPEGDWISDWYRGMLFSRFGKPAIRRLAAVLEHVARGKDVRRLDLLEKVRRKYTWDATARSVVERLLEVQPT